MSKTIRVSDQAYAVIEDHLRSLSGLVHKRTLTDAVDSLLRDQIDLAQNSVALSDLVNRHFSPEYDKASLSISSAASLRVGEEIVNLFQQNAIALRMSTFDQSKTKFVIYRRNGNEMIAEFERE